MKKGNKGKLSLYDKVFKPVHYTLENGSTIDEKRSRVPLILVILVIATIAAGEVTGFSFSTLANRISYFFIILSDMVPPDWSYMPRVWQPLMDTIKMSLLGSFVGAVLCIPFSVLCSSNLVSKKVITGFFKLFYSIVRTLPTLVIALIATYIFGLGTFAGTVAIAVFTFAYCGKILYEQIETVDMGSYEALQALGMGRISAIRYAVWPQVLPSFISTVLFCFEGNVRYASILGYVGAGGLGIILNERIGWMEYARVGMILLSLFFTVVIIELISSRLRARLVQGEN